MTAYKTKVLNTVHYIEVPFSNNSCDTKSFQANFESWLKLPVDLHIFDFKNVANIDSNFYDLFQKFKVAAQVKYAQVVSINILPQLFNSLKNEGRDQAFALVKNLELLKKAKPIDSKHEMQTWVVKYAVSAARAAMDTLFRTTVAADENYRESGRNFDPRSFYRIARVNIRASLIHFDFLLYFDRTTLESLTQVLVGSSTTPLDIDVVESTALELLNLIYSGTKSKLNTDRDYNLPSAIPALDAGLSIWSTNTEHNIHLIPMATPVGTFFLGIDFGSSSE